jgi:hypothetical protein
MTTAARPPGLVPAGLAQAAVDVLEEAELLVAGAVSEVRARGQSAAFLGAERRIGENDIGLLLLAEVFADAAQGVA